MYQKYRHYLSFRNSVWERRFQKRRFASRGIETEFPALRFQILIQPPLPSDASMSNTSEDLPDPDTPVKMVILRLGSLERDIL